MNALGEALKINSVFSAYPLRLCGSNLSFVRLVKVMLSIVSTLHSFVSYATVESSKLTVDIKMKNE